jgi:glutamine---fructose-6-phosphate transaminase (isomerizing)
MAIPIIEGAYLKDILEQPEALGRFLAEAKLDERLSALVKKGVTGQYKRVILTGMGSSFHALYPLYLRLIAQGLSVYHVETAELIYYQSALLKADSLIIAVSQSGRSGEIVTLLDMVKGQGGLIGVTNDEASPLAQEALVSLFLKAGPESTVSCKTYVNTLAALTLIGSVFSSDGFEAVKQELSLAKGLIETYLKGWRAHVTELQLTLQHTRQVFVVGRGASVATAETGGLILKESTRQACEGMSSPAFRHGPFEVLGPDIFVAVIAGDETATPFNVRLMADIEAAHGQTFSIGHQSQLQSFKIGQMPQALSQMIEILPIQMVSLALASLKGHEAGRFERASKITSVE